MELLTILGLLIGKMINPILWIILFIIYKLKLNYITTILIVCFLSLICNNILIYAFTFKLDIFSILLDFISYIVFSSILLKLLQLKQKK